MNKLYAWDELGCTLEERDAEELRELNMEGGWEYTKHYSNGVARLETDRHVALEVWAPNIEIANALMMIDPTYGEYHE